MITYEFVLDLAQEAIEDNFLEISPWEFVKKVHKEVEEGLTNDQKGELYEIFDKAMNSDGERAEDYVADVSEVLGIEL